MKLEMPIGTVLKEDDRGFIRRRLMDPSMQMNEGARMAFENRLAELDAEIPCKTYPPQNLTIDRIVLVQVKEEWFTPSATDPLNGLPYNIEYDVTRKLLTIGHENFKIIAKPGQWLAVNDWNGVCLVELEDIDSLMSMKFYSCHLQLDDTPVEHLYKL